MESNKFALQCMGGEKYDRWEKIGVEELTALMGFMLLMGIVHLPSLPDYWKRDEVRHYAPVARRISRNRFFDLQRYLHFADNTTLAAPGTTEYNKLGKIQPVLDALCKRFQEVYNVHRDVSIDEAMIPFKGRSSMKQYMPLKPVKRGFKVWTLADAHTGYVYSLEVYTGKKGDTVEKGLGARVIHTLSRPLQHRYMYMNVHFMEPYLRNPHRYHHLYFDNLLLDLLKVGLYGCGTLRSNRRGFPTDLKPYVKKGLKERGDSRTRQHKTLSVALWQDSRPVVVAATTADPTVSTTILRKGRDGTRSDYTCPQSIALYNKYMGGVDYNDQLRQYYHVRMKGRKYYKYVWWFLFDSAVTNAYVLCKHHTYLSVPSLKDFRIDLAKALIGDYCSRKRPGRPSATPTAHTNPAKPSLTHACRMSSSSSGFEER